MVTPVFAHIGAVDLFEILWQTLEPKWNKESRGFVLDPRTDLELYDKNYCLIAPPQPPETDNAAISSFFFSKLGKKGERKFKVGTTVVYVCMTHEVYDKWQNYCNDVELEYRGLSKNKPVSQVVSCQLFSNCFHKPYHLSHPSHDAQAPRATSSKVVTRASKSTVGCLLNFQPELY